MDQKRTDGADEGARSWQELDPAVYYYESDFFPPPEALRLGPAWHGPSLSAEGRVDDDVLRFRELAEQTGGPVLDLCCGMGRVAIPLARAGFEVTGADLSPGMLEQFRIKLKQETDCTARRIQIVQQDVTTLCLPRRDYRLAVLAFSSLLSIADFAGQCQALSCAAAHLVPGGRLVLDLINPLIVNLHGEGPRPQAPRRNLYNGRVYTRFVTSDPMDEQQRQRLHGWYDELDDDGGVHRYHYSRAWRPVFRGELELMLKQAGLMLLSLDGGYHGEPYAPNSRRMFVQAERPGPSPSGGG